MATVVRLKRRRDEDPLEILLLAAKKQRNEKADGAQGDVTADKSVFKFAGTVSSKGDGISHHVREAIRKEKLEREYRQHQSNILGTVKQESRQHKYMKSQQNRFKVISKHRALDLNCLDERNALKEDICKKCGQKIHQTQTCSKKRSETVTERTVPDDSISDIERNLEKEKITGKCNDTEEEEQYCKCDNVDHDKESDKENKGKVKKCVKDKHDSEDGKGAEREHIVQSDRIGDAGDGLFCLVDMEAENSVSKQSVGSSTADQITCNSEPMEREIVSERSEGDDYVYDIYYTNSRQFDFRMFERDLTFEAFSSDLMFDREGDNGDDEFVYEDDEDENAESNWRNDYPDEDPQYFENEHSNYSYGNELEEYEAFETETGNQMSDWMSWRCNIDGAELSSDEEDVEHYGDKGTSYDSYYKHVRKEMGADAGDESDNS